MPIFIFLVAWIFAVCAMTGFSALISKIIGREVREHHLLAQLLHTLKSDNIRKPPSVLKGWIIHFVMGLFFLALYELLWIITAVDRNFLWSIIFGMFIGVIGILGWMI